MSIIDNKSVKAAIRSIHISTGSYKSNPDADEYLRGRVSRKGAGA
jgi:hypothetical protein